MTSMKYWEIKYNLVCGQYLKVGPSKIQWNLLGTGEESLIDILLYLKVIAFKKKMQEGGDILKMKTILSTW